MKDAREQTAETLGLSGYLGCTGSIEGRAPSVLPTAQDDGPKRVIVPGEALEPDALAKVCRAEQAEAAGRINGRRRCDADGSRDQRLYQAGAADERAGALDIPDVVKVGLKCGGLLTVTWLQEAINSILEESPDGNPGLYDLLRHVLRDPRKRRYLVELGTWECWRFEAAVYRECVKAFEASVAGRDPAARWRFKPVTRFQRTTIDLITEMAIRRGETVASAPTNRGEAHDWIAAQHGNPRFAEEPLRPVWDN